MSWQFLFDHLEPIQCFDDSHHQWWPIKCFGCVAPSASDSGFREVATPRLPVGLNPSFGLACLAASHLPCCPAALLISQLSLCLAALWPHLGSYAHHTSQPGRDFLSSQGVQTFGLVGDSLLPTTHTTNNIGVLFVRPASGTTSNNTWRLTDIAVPLNCPSRRLFVDTLSNQLRSNIPPANRPTCRLTLTLPVRTCRHDTMPQDRRRPPASPF